MTVKTQNYYVPDQSIWPILTSAALFITAIGAATTVHQVSPLGLSEGTSGKYILLAGIFSIIFCMFGWFRDTVLESQTGKNSIQMDISYRMGMAWFIFSEVMFFVAFFGALFYARWLAVPWLGGEGSKPMTHEILWPDFQAMWPLTKTPDGHEFKAMGPFPLPLINTLLLISSGFFLTLSHHALRAGQSIKKIAAPLAVSVVLGFIFLGVQVYEYIHAYRDLGLKLDAGIYGGLFFMLTGFHGMHVCIGAIMLTIMLIRVLKGHFSVENHFAFEAAAWYWHFVDVVWIFLFFTVYWL
jgi:cytochrome c oxidase subunit 3